MNQSNKPAKVSHGEDIVTFNVGGELFTTYRSTVLESDSTVLHDLVNKNRPQQDLKMQQEPIFIDRNGELFRDVIFYLRTNHIYTKDLAKLAALVKEAIYYEIDSMGDALQESIDATKIQQEKRQKKPRVVLMDVKEMCKTLSDTKAAHPTTYKIVEERDGVEKTYSVLDIVYVKDINTCFEHGKPYCACSSTPKLVLAPKSTEQ
ncbi:uncharacterized protein ATC70_004061 [Mucor velutinosus]|uniref:Potassium channel tetramerisation-type BTB domain-containing protein n=1 Tax=Mucor velutinosus TaxID=708070 RepID=A0AAN7DPH2_9FUNG|nr:hypothetical protein ATC70_004061 [Mucor velutinosus]